MLVRADIHRSIAGISIDLHRQMAKKRAESTWTKAAEFEVQFQVPVSGSFNTLNVSGPPAPIETTIPLDFGFLFAGFPGAQRRSQLDRPHVRGSVELAKDGINRGVIPYYFVTDWKQDSNKNYTAALVLVGIYPIPGAADLKKPVKATLHVAFQGFGTLPVNSNQDQ